MEVDISYGKEKVKINVDEKCNILLPNKIKIKNQDKLIQKALKNPLDTEKFEDFVEKSKKLLIIVNDASKPTPTSTILNYISPILSKHSNYNFLIATGTHKRPNDEQIQDIFGQYYDEYKEKIHIHNSKDKKNMIYLGKTQKGTDLYINKMVMDAKNIIVIGSVEPHYFAGYTGGRKAFFPGVAAYDTIEMNHKFALEDKACTLCLDTNPLHQDLTEAINFLDKLNIFSIQCVLTNDYKIYSVKCGDIIKSFNESIRFAKDVYCVPIKEKANIILTVVPYPMDINLYQSQHSLENAKLALGKDGIIILVSKCREGIGNDAFVKLLSKSESPDQVIKLIGGKYKLGSHKSIRILKLKEKAEIFAVTDLNAEIIKKVKFRPYKNIQTAVDESIKIIKSKGKIPKILIIPYGNLTIPYMEG